MQVKYFNKPTKHLMQRKTIVRTVKRLATYAGYTVLAIASYIALFVIAV